SPVASQHRCVMACAAAKLSQLQNGTSAGFGGGAPGGFLGGGGGGFENHLRGGGGWGKKKYYFNEASCVAKGGGERMGGAKRPRVAGQRLGQRNAGRA